jgi:transposase
MRGAQCGEQAERDAWKKGPPIHHWSTSSTIKVQSYLLSWLDCPTEAFKRLGGVSATVRVDNEQTAIVHGAGAWGTINTSYRRCTAVMRFHVDACPLRQPQTKGTVERKVRDQRMSARSERPVLARSGRVAVVERRAC